MRNFYDTFGWQKDEATGQHLAELLLEDQGDAAQRYRFGHELRYRKYFHPGGNLFLDAGCGGEPRKELSRDFQSHICVDISVVGLKSARERLAGIPQIKPTVLDIAPSGIPSNRIPHSKGVKCGLIRSNFPFSYSNHRPAKPKIPKPLVYAQVSPLGTSFATP